MKNGTVILVVAVLAGSLIWIGSVYRARTQASQERLRLIRAQEALVRKANAERKAQLIQKINRYWQLREEADERGIDTSQVPVMPYVVGQDGNIYRILPSGDYQRVPDDQFHEPASPTAVKLQGISI